MWGDRVSLEHKPDRFDVNRLVLAPRVNELRRGCHWGRLSEPLQQPQAHFLHFSNTLDPEMGDGSILHCVNGKLWSNPLIAACAPAVSLPS